MRETETREANETRDKRSPVQSDFHDVEFSMHVMSRSSAECNKPTSMNKHHKHHKHETTARHEASKHGA